MADRVPIPVESDRIGPEAARLYRVQTDDGVELAVTRLGASASPGEPVILVHGTFCQRSFWVSDKGLGLGPYLRDRGFDVWIPEVRGHGRSPRDRRYRTWTAEDQMRFDLPAVQGLVQSERGGRAHWVGHSWGGVAILGAIGGGWLVEDQIQSAVVLGANITEGDEWLKRPLPRAAAWTVLTLAGRVPAGLFRLGPEPESRGYMLDFFRWKGPRAEWCTADGASYWDGVRDAKVPLLAFAAANDETDPVPGCRFMFDAFGAEDKEWVLLGVEQGFSKDYGHVEMIVSKPARREVWPRIADWLDAHASG
jgi:pimeloyl-ACP methyl ester carboxylesterase